MYIVSLDKSYYPEVHIVETLEQARELRDVLRGHHELRSDRGPPCTIYISQLVEQIEFQSY